jgi:Domain of unknown function (DUF4270)
MFKHNPSAPQCLRQEPEFSETIIMSNKNILILFIVIVSASCTKVDVTFGNDDLTGDPDISYIEDYPVELATYKIDSFITSSHSVFTIGHHTDSSFGTITAGAYAEVNLPSENPVKNKNVSFDSLVVILKPNGNYYGDTLTPFKINIHRLLENIENEEQANTDFYNPRKFQFNPVPFGQTIVTVKPKRGSAIKVRLSDSFGQDLLMKFKNNNDSIQAQEIFSRYFKGLYLGTDTSFTKAMYYFVSDSTEMIMRLHYKLNGATIQEKYFDFSFNTAKQYNQIVYNHTGTNLGAFTPFKKQLKKSSATGNKAYLHSNMGSYIKISFPSILNIKELHPYIKIIKAELVIKPSADTYSYPYLLPSSLNLYSTDENNGLNSLVQSGGLYIDNLYGEKTQYTYDITDYITDIISQGRFSTDALMLTPSSEVSDKLLERLIINDQTFNKGVQLKLYVLGL